MNYTIIDKEEFIALYKFGEISLQNHRVIVSNNEKEVRTSLLRALKELPFSEYEEEFLIASLDSEPKKGRLHISSLSGLIPLSEKAKNSYERKFDRRIRFRAPRFESILDDYFEYVELMDHKNGAKALSQMFGCHGDYSEIVSGNHFLEAWRRKNKGERSHSFQGDFFTHLFVYDRYDFFPRTDVGYLYDIGTILANSKGKSDFIGSSFHAFLDKNQSHFDNLKLRDLFKEMEESPDLEGLRSALTLKGGLRLYIAGAIFLKYKDECKGADTIFDTSLRGVVGTERKDHEFIDEFELAIYLTGLFFGFQKFNKDYYRTVNLSIFQDEKAASEVREPTPDAVGGLDSQENAEAEGESDKGNNATADAKSDGVDKDEFKEKEDKPERKPYDAEWDFTTEPQSKSQDESSDDKEAEVDKPTVVVDSNKDTSPVEKKSETGSGLTEKEEAKINQLEEIFSREGGKIIRISSIKKELGFSTNQPIKNIVKKDQKARFNTTKDGSADALIRAKPGLFGQPKYDK